MMTSSGSQLFTKVTGYLEKKGRLRIGSLWKKYWFVLEGRLLLYYRSKDEYEAISPCKGSINLCPPCTIKPAAATSCVFQIIGRATTVTLRAESRYEQERWMQALLMAIDNSKPSPTRLSHFRYSLDELPMPYQENEIPENGLQRQHSMTYNTSSTPKQDIIGRLQLIGAHTYGGSLDTFTKYAPTIQQTDIVNNKYNNKTSSNISLRNGSPEVLTENDQYSIIQEENSLDILMDVHNYKTISLEQIGNIKDKSPSLLPDTYMIDNDQYRQLTKTRDKNCIRNKKLKKSESLYERISGDSNKFSVVKLRRKNSNIYERISSSFSGSEKQSKLNSQNSLVQKQSQESLQSQKEPEYSTPMNAEDHNKNSLIIDNEQYMPGLVNPNNNEYAKVDQINEVEELYEDPDTFYKRPEYEPALPPRPNTKKFGENSTSSTIDENRNKKRRGLHILAQLIKSEKKIEADNQSARPKKKRSTSFIHRMLGKKEKPVEKTEDVIYAVIDNNIEKPKNANDIQMLQELQIILESRKTLLQKKLKANASQNTENISNISEVPSTKTVVVIEKRPSLPPRQNSQSSITHSNQQTNLTNTVDPVAKDEVNTHTNIVNNQIKTIDEIIEDLDREKDMQDSNHKVKELIEKFNDLHNEDEILFRRKLKSNLQRSETFSGVPLTFSKLNIVGRKESDELSRLLNELSKVTCAPVLTPGATSSLTTPVISDDEVKPLRYRRLSDPDYDIPRPHTSLQLENLARPLPENVIPATRFFGPVLPTTDKITTVFI